MAVNRRALTDAEAPWLELAVERPWELRDRLLLAGYSRTVAAGIVDWLQGKARGAEDLTASDTRSRYRRILRSLGGPGPTARVRPRLHEQFRGSATALVRRPIPAVGTAALAA
jgi:hypothetical protein